MLRRQGIAAAFALAAVAFPCSAFAGPADAGPSPAGSSEADDVDLPASPAPSAAPASPPPSAAPASPPPPPSAAPASSAIPAPPAVAPPDPAGEIASLRARIDALEAKSAHEPAHPIILGDPTNAPSTSLDASPWSRLWPRGLQLGGYVQGQYQSSQVSQDQLDANGTPFNQDRFLVRRARLRVDRSWDFAAATFEVDGNNNSGLSFGIRRAEASLLWRAPDPDAPPWAVFSVGLTDVPFGYELFEPNRARVFLERTTASRAFFPGDNDFAAKISGAVGPFRYAVALLDGTPVPDSNPASAGFDSTSEKDILARLGGEAKVHRDLDVAGGVSFVRGTGFHAGSPATKGSLQWSDLNGNGQVDAGETTGLPGSASTPSSTFSRWAFGFDLELRFTTWLGRGMLYGEGYVGSNYDRGLFVADPVSTGINLREIGGYIAFLHEVTRYGIVGVRVDLYDPNADATTARAGTLLPLDQTITTYSPLVGLVLPDRARLVFEYDRVVDREGIDARGVPTDLRNDTWALRLEVQL